MSLSDILTRAPPPKGERIWYGLDRLQFAELRFPRGEGPFPLLFVVHGGWWLSEYDLVHIGHLCAKLTSRGIVTCSIEYRRVGDPGGGWPGTFLDVSNAIEYFKNRMANDDRIDTKRAAVIGHSAGGHLALWLGGKRRVPKDSILYTDQNPWLVAVVSLAGVADLSAAWNLRLGDDAVGKLIGGGPDQYPERYIAGSPVELLPMGVKQVLIHGRVDDRVPISLSERFVERARTVGDHPSFIALDGIGHFEVIDPESRAWSAVERTTLELLKDNTKSHTTDKT